MPEPQVLDDGVWRVPLRTPTLPPATSTNTLLVGTRDLAVIEPATPDPDEQAALDEILAARVRRGARVAAILITHHHADHTGYAVALARRHGAPLYAHAATAERVRFPVDVTLRDQDRLELGDGYAIRALHTPGHAPGHLAFFEERTRLVHAGDLVASDSTIVIDPDDGGDMSAYLNSLARLAAEAPLGLVPAHGTVIAAPQEFLARYITHRRQREAKVLAALRSAPAPFAEILAAVYADTPQHVWWLAERSLEAHLRKLESEGRVARRGDQVSLLPLP